MFRKFTPAASCSSAEISSPPLVSAPTIGKLQAVMGSVTITHTANVAQAVAGDSIYQGDVIETGGDGSATLSFVDGNGFRLYANTVMVLDEFACESERSSRSTLFRIVKGMFAVITGKLATAGRLIIETPFGQIQSNVPGIGIGSLAFGILTFSVIKDLKAASADLGLLDDEFD